MIPESSDALVMWLRELEIPLPSLDPRAPLEVAAAAGLGARIALLLGGERRGASSYLREEAAQALRIPMSARLESLNVSVAAAIALHERHSATSAVRRTS